MKVFGQLEKAQLENTTSDTGSLPKGMITYRTDLNLPKVSDGTGMITLADVSTAQTLTNKTLTSPVLTGPQVTSGGLLLTQIATPSTPAAGVNKLYPKADKQLYILDETGLETQVGSGGGGGGKNYLQTVNNINGNGNFDLGSTAKWSLFNTTLTSLIPTGSITAGAGSITTFTVTTSGKLAGTYSLSVAGSGAITAGQGFLSDAVTIDTEDQARVMSYKFSYSVVSGASNLNFSGTSANTFAVYIYDVTNSLWIQPAGVYGMTQNSGVGIAQGSFQTSSNGTSYRLAVIAVNASAGAASLLFDSFQLGPQAIVQGTPVTSWKDYPLTIGATTTPPTKGTVVYDKAQWRRVGDTMEIRYDFAQSAAGAAGSGDYLFPLPTGYFIDTAKVTAVPNFNSQSLGSAGVRTASSEFVALARIHDASNFKLLYNDTISTTAIVGSTNAALSNTIIRYTYTAVVPIAGWDSNVQMSQDTDTRVVAASMSGDPASATAGNPIIFPTAADDTHGAWNGTTGRYTAPVSGWYQLGGYIDSTNANVQLEVFVDGVFNKRVGYTDAAGEGSVSGIVKVNAGQLIDLRPSATLDANSNSVFFISRVSGPSVIAANEFVGASVHSAGTTVGTTATVAIFGTKAYDSHGSYNTSTGEFTAPIAGKFSVQAFMAVSGSGPSSSSANRAIIASVYKNGVFERRLNSFIFQVASTAIGPVLAGSTTVECVAGDKLTVTIQRHADIGTYNLDSASSGTSAMFTKVNH